MGQKIGIKIGKQKLLLSYSQEVTQFISTATVITLHRTEEAVQEVTCSINIDSAIVDRNLINMYICTSTDGLTENMIKHDLACIL